MMVTTRSLLMRRAFARILDSVVEGLLASAVLGFFVDNRNGDRVVDPPVAIVVLVIFGLFLYECFSLRAVGATPGKVALKLRVRTVDGYELGWPEALRRSLVPTAVIAICVALPFARGVMPAIVTLLYATALGLPDHRGIVDRVAGTQVMPAELTR